MYVKSPSEHSRIQQEHVESVRKGKTRKQLKPREEMKFPSPWEHGTAVGTRSETWECGIAGKAMGTRAHNQNTPRLGNKGGGPLFIGTCD